MQKVKRIALLFSIFLILLISIAAVSAANADDNLSSGVNEEIVETGIGLDECSLNYPLDESVEDNEDRVLCSDSSSNGADSKSSLKGNGKSSLKDSLDSVYNVDSDNLDSFFADGFLKDDYADSILVFNGEFNDKGILDIKSSNVTIIGNNSLLKNTAFCIESNNIMLAGLNFVWNREFSDNDNAGILVLGDNCTIYNCTIDYSVPETTTGFCVYAEGSDGDKIENFTLANSTINFVGNNLRGGWDYCIFIDQVENAMVYGNNINSSLPLRAVDYSFDIFGGVSMEAVGVFVAQSCPNLTFSSNKVFSSVNGGGKTYPTLDTLVIYGCNNAKIENNDIHVEDFNSKDGKDNYLQGIDLYFSNNVTIVHNKIDMITTGGRAGMGTAYPIQVNGPSKGVLIAYNNLTTFNYGPNCGIYSMNYYGQTQNYMISNFINVTGVASTHYYALVAGIEVQDSDDLIWNNTIIVNNIGEYNDANNIYGISYSQSTDGNHTYNIQYNNVTTNGRYAVSLSGPQSLVVDSIIANNVLNTNKSSGNRAVRVGAGYNNTIRNNTDGVFRNTLNPDDLPDWLKNHKGLVPRIVVPRYYREGSNGSGLTDDEGNGAAPWNTGSNPNGDTVFGSNRDTAPGFGGDASPSFTAASPGESGSSAADPNAYEIDEQDNVVSKSSDYFQLGIICIVALLLLLVGYKRQKDKEEEE
ncbi:right-handed parallel beta-helix repeat-containing protein [uncultured Methanobrevibacter sp.]|uniref:right-handed parallel beta-helix repeat-containing protein n=1 Tax=uncultured Methanobrevibacter sp. TaxID=253161 RepID=UPI0025E3DED6|nr:right-handed parallel beta-helix repeat-containing protein [uncultured Methanobrevibacter sp.]